MAVRSIINASRAQSRPFAAIGSLLLCLGLAAAAAGGYFYYTVMGMEAAPYSALLSLVSDGAHDEDGANAEGEDKPEPKAAPADQLPDDPSAPSDDRPEQTMYKLDVTKQRALGLALLGGGALFALLGLRTFRKRRYFVVCRSRDGIMRIVVTGDTQQSIILATLQAVQ